MRHVRTHTQRLVLLLVLLYSISLCSGLVNCAYATEQEDNSRGVAFSFGPSKDTDAVEEPAAKDEETIVEKSILQLEPDNVLVPKGKRVDIKPIYDVDALGKGAKIKWSTEDKSIATVDNGAVFGKSMGKTKITCNATFKDGTEASQSCSVTVYQPVESITASKKSLTILVGKKPYDLPEIKIKPENATYPDITWSSSDTSVVEVNAKGQILGIAKGKAVVTGVLDEPNVKQQKKVQIQVTVNQGTSKIVLSASSITVGKGKTQKINVTVSPDNATNKKVVWSSSDDKIATASNGTISGKKTGTCTIKAVAADGSGAEAVCKVTVIQSVTSIKPDQNRIVINEGDTARASVTVNPADATNKKISWSSENSYIAAVDSRGYITGKNAGKCKIYASSTDGSDKRASINVIIEPINPISLDSIGFGIYNYNLLGMTVTNRCSTKVIKDFDFDMTMYDYMGNVVNSGSYSLGSAVTIGPGSTKTIKRTVYGVGQAYKIKITITGVTYSGGETYYIPRSSQETWSFTR